MNLPLQDKKQAGSIETLPVIPPVTDKASSAAPGDVATMIQSGEETVADEGDQVPPIHRTPANRQTQAVSPETAGVASEETLDDTPAGLAFGQQVPAELHISGLNSRMEPKQAGTTADPQATLIGGPQAVRDLEDLLETLVENKTSDGSVPNGVAGLVIGDYQVISELGRGGMGVVYKARHRKLNRVVALKMILSGKHAGGEALRRFLAEARAVAQMQHPGIVQIFDIGEHQGLPYFSLEYVAGKDLLRDLDGKPTNAKKAATMVQKLCTAMQYAHENGILHRDLKPANVLLDENGIPKITDFGLAREIDAEGSTATNEGTIMGSPSYMPPEQARGKLSELSPKSDLYSLGAVLYQMLTARPPFIAERVMDTVMQVINNEPVSPRDLQPGVPIDLETICMKALQKDQAARYENCAAMAADLQRFLNEEPILARPVSRLERTWRWCKRNPGIAIPSTLAGLFLTLTAVIATWAWLATSAQAAVITQQKKAVEQQRDETEQQRGIANQQRDEADRQRIIANQQKVLAEENEERARKQATLALQNIQFVLTEFDASLKKQPGASELRISILEAVSKKWDQLDLEMTGGIRGEAIPTLMALRQQIAGAFYELDKLTEADREYSRLYKMAEERIGIKGRTDSARTNLAKISMAWAPVKRRLGSDPEAAMTLLQDAVKIVRECLTDPQPQPGSPSQNDIHELLAILLQNVGVEYLEQGRLPETAQAFEEALSTMATVLNNIRSEPGFADLSEDARDGKTAARQIGHDKSALGLAYILMRLGKTERSLQLYDQAIAGRREIYNRRQSMLPLKLELAGHLGNYGQALLWIQKPDQAEPLIRESVTLFEEIFAADPEKADYKRQLTTALYRMGTLRDLQGHAVEATSLFERCRQLREELNSASPDEKNRINSMLAEARTGRFETAQKLIDELAADEKKDGERHLERARALTQLSVHAAPEKKAEYVTAALTALERSVAEGYSDPFRINAEPDLAPVRNEDRFKAAVASMQPAP